MTSTPERAQLHYAVDATSCPSHAWRAVAAHHLLVSRHRPEATASFPGIDQTTARQLRIYATELGLSGLRIPGEPSSVTIEITAGVAPSVLCEAIDMLLDAAAGSG